MDCGQSILLEFLKTSLQIVTKYWHKVEVSPIMWWEATSRPYFSLWYKTYVNLPNDQILRLFQFLPFHQFLPSHYLPMLFLWFNLIPQVLEVICLFKWNLYTYNTEVSHIRRIYSWVMNIYFILLSFISSPIIWPNQLT